MKRRTFIAGLKINLHFFNRITTPRFVGIVYALFFFSLALVAYSNNFKHDYHLDSGHLILDNSAVRSLKNIPSYFYDPSTLTSLRSNIDYRPVLQITYAINYFISGYDTWSWHLVQILLHGVCALGLSLFCFIIMMQFGSGEKTARQARQTRLARLASFAIAVIFTLHPTASGVVNYLSARSSLLTAAFLLPSLCAYMRPYEHARYARAPIAAAVLYCLALFTKVEAIGALPVFFLYETLQIARRRLKPGETDHARRHGPLRDLIATLTPPTFRRLWPFLAVTAVYCIIRMIIMAGYDTGARHAADVTPCVYFLTQLTAWWHYVGLWFAPVNLVADNMNYPIFRSMLAGPVMLATGGWLLVAAIVRMSYGTHPFLFFLTLSALALIAPTSSFAPLAEMVNEHRPYLPLAILSCAWLLPLASRCIRYCAQCKAGTIIGLAGLVLVCASFFVLTRQRNLVFSTEKAYYADILAKAPSARAHANYGLTFLKEGRFDEALGQYLQALRMAPNWHIVHINLGLIYQALGNDSLARRHFDLGVETDRYSATARPYRGEYFLAKRQWAEALADFKHALPLNREKYRLWKGAAEASSGLGDWPQAIAYCVDCRAADQRQLELDMVSISRPYWERPDLYEKGIRFYTKIDSLLPGRWWVHHNLGDLAFRCGNIPESTREFAIAKKLKAQTPALPGK